jgi:hypothetical protein
MRPHPHSTRPRDHMRRASRATPQHRSRRTRALRGCLLRLPAPGMAAARRGMTHARPPDRAQAHRDADEVLARRAAARSGPEAGPDDNTEAGPCLRFPAHGHVLYLAVGSEVLDSPPDLLLLLLLLLLLGVWFAQSAATYLMPQVRGPTVILDDGGPDSRRMLHLYVAPARRGRLLRSCPQRTSPCSLVCLFAAAC